MVGRRGVERFLNREHILRRSDYKTFLNKVADTPFLIQGDEVMIDLS